jgi:hypothetical protein
MKILCLIYSIPDPLQSNNQATSTSTTAPLHPLDRNAASASSTVGQASQVAPMASSTDSLVETLPDAPEDVHPEEAAGDLDTATIRKGHQPNTVSQDWELESDRERRGLIRDRPRNREREYDASTASNRQPVQQSTVLDDVSGTLRPLYTAAPPRALSHEIVGPTTTSIPISLSALRNSVLPPPRPPPSGPLPNRPRMPSGSNIPPQLLNQPLPPLPPLPSPQVCQPVPFKYDISSDTLNFFPLTCTRANLRR